MLSMSFNLCLRNNPTSENMRYGLKPVRRKNIETNVQSTQSLISAIEVIRKMGNSVPSYCKECRTVGIFGMKCFCQSIISQIINPLI